MLPIIQEVGRRQVDLCKARVSSRTVTHTHTQRKEKCKLPSVVHTFNPSPGEAEAGRFEASQSCTVRSRLNKPTFQSPLNTNAFTAF